MDQAHYILIETGPDAGRRYELGADSLVIGRDPASDIVLDDIEVSRRHARLIPQSDGYVIEDMGSTNGTYVDEARIRSVMPLKPGTRVRLGENITFLFESEQGAMADTGPLPMMPPESVAAPEPIPMEASVLQEAESRRAQARQVPPPEEAPPRRAARRPRPAWMSNPIAVGCAILLLLGLCGFIAFLWYVDANFLWCDVFPWFFSACQ